MAVIPLLHVFEAASVIFFAPLDSVRNSRDAPNCIRTPKMALRRTLTLYQYLASKMGRLISKTYVVPSEHPCPNYWPSAPCVKARHPGLRRFDLSHGDTRLGALVFVPCSANTTPIPAAARGATARPTKAEPRLVGTNLSEAFRINAGNPL